MRTFTTLVLAFIISGILGTSVYASQSPDVSSVRITEETTFIFTPTSTGYWTFSVSGYTDNAHPSIRIYNIYGHFLSETLFFSDYVTSHLVEGADYIIVAGFSWGDSGSYTLNVFAVDYFDLYGITSFEPLTEIIPGEGGTIQVPWIAGVTFIPGTTGLWLIESAADNEAATGLVIEDSHGNLIAWNEHFSDLMVGRIVTHLVAGAEYIITVVPDDFDTLMYTISVSPTNDFEPWFYDWDDIFEYIPEEMEAIPSSGDEIDVLGETWFTFVPDTTGLWSFVVSEPTGEPFLVLTDSYRSFITADEVNFGSSRDVFVSMYLAEGVEYLVWARFEEDNAAGSYTLSVFPGAPAEQLVVATSDNFSRTFPSNGGRIPLEERWFGNISFTPNTTGSWTVQASEEAIMLSVMDAGSENYVSFIIGHMTSRALGWRLSNVPLITLDLAAGVEYGIFVSLEAGTEGTLVVSPSNQLHYSVDGTFLRQVVRETYFDFIPETSGIWTFSTTPGFGSNPTLRLMDSNGNIIAQDDNDNGNPNAFISMELTAGESYILRAGFVADEEGRYLLTVCSGTAQPATQPRDFPRLPSPDR